MYLTAMGLTRHCTSVGGAKANPKFLQYERSIHKIVINIFSRAKYEGYLAPGEDLAKLRAIIHTHLYGIISKMKLGDLTRSTSGINDPDTTRAAVQMFNEKFFRKKQ